MVTRRRQVVFTAACSPVADAEGACRPPADGYSGLLWRRPRRAEVGGYRPAASDNHRPGA